MTAVIAESVSTATSSYEIERDKPMPNAIHSSIQAQMLFLLKTHYREKYSSRSELTLDTKPKSSTPDICIYPKQKIDIYHVEAKEKTPPFTTIEIQSPSQSIEELRDKAFQLYFPMGVQSAWIVIPAIRAIQIFTPNEKFTIFTEGNVFDSTTNIELSIDDIFEELEY